MINAFTLTGTGGHRRRWAMFIGAAGGACLVGSAAAVEPTYTFVALMVALAAGVLILRPAWGLIGFAVAVIFGEWVYDAQRIGLSALPYRIVSISWWVPAIVVLGLVAYGRIPEKAELKRRVSSIGIPLIAWSAAVAISVVITAVTFPQDFVQVLPDAPLLIAPLAVAILLYSTGRPTAGLLLVVALLVAELTYAAAQVPRLEFGSNVSLVTVGSEARWWDTRAVYGTFALTGNHAFADTLVLLGSVLLPWAIMDRLGRTARVLILALYLAVVVMVALSLARAGLVSLAVAAAATVVSRDTRRATWVAIALAGAVVGLSQATDALSLVYARGFIDTSATYRLVVWEALAAHPQAAWILGTGAESIARETQALGIYVPHVGDQTLGPTTDNLYLRTLVEAGILGIVAFVWLLCRMWAESLGRSRTVAGVVWRRALRGLVVALAVQSTTSDTVANAQLAGAFACVLGAVIAGLLFDALGDDLRRPSLPLVSIGTAVGTEV